MEEQDRVETPFDRIVAALHEAMLDETRWREASILIDEACGLAGSHLVVLGGDDNDAAWLFDKAYWRGEFREELARDYALNYFPRDERIPRMLALPDRRVVRVADLLTDRELRTSPTYNELLTPAGSADGLNIRMDGPHGLHIVWALAGLDRTGRLELRANQADRALAAPYPPIRPGAQCAGRRRSAEYVTRRPAGQYAGRRDLPGLARGRSSRPTTAPAPFCAAATA